MKNIVGMGVFFFSLLGIAAAQSTITFTLENPAEIGTTSLPAGHYTVRESLSNGGAAVLLFTGPDGLRKNVLATETAATGETVDHSGVILKSDGERMRVDKVMIEGHNYGFQIVQ
jgi:pectin methylesterase-like acyl-CoA thioesterase